MTPGQELKVEVAKLIPSFFNVPEFQQYMEPIYPEDSVTGDLYLDDAHMAGMLRVRAKATGVTIVAEAQLVSIIRAMQAVFNGLGVSREQRRAQADA